MTGVTPSGPGSRASHEAASASSPKASIPNAAELALLCEQMPDGNRELDVLIAVMIDWRWPEWEEGESTARGSAEKHGIEWLIGRTTEGLASMWRHIPRYTASVDAAVTLVPDGWFWMAGHRDNNRCRAYVNNGESHFVGIAARSNPTKRWFECLADTPALALCAASLKARAASAIEARSDATPKSDAAEGESAGPQDDAR